ncbi:hypothetical protein [Stygiolobus caldivivus]|nr:hypothetical protein [Stygiolobus caldivivus]
MTTTVLLSEYSLSLQCLADVSGGKIVSVEIADEFLENSIQLSKYSENVM